MKSKNEKILKDLTEFCKLNPQYRFWQAVYAWLGLIGSGGIKIQGQDPFYWEDKLPIKQSK